MKLSIVSPVYGAEDIIDKLVERISEEAEKVTSDFEVILVDDRGPDNSWQKILDNCLRDSRVKGIRLSRNFGQHFAITAGLKAAKGDYVIVMDCDLQDNPKYFPDLVAKANEGAHVVFTQKKSRKHSWFKNITSNLFFGIFNFLADNAMVKGSDKVGVYSLISRQAVNAFLQMGDYRRHYLMILRWIGFSHAFIEVEHSERYSGKSSYDLSKLINHALDGILAQSDKLLRLTAAFGFILSFCAFIAAIVIIIRYFISPFQAGWASLSVLILMLSGLTILSIGVCGMYIGKIFEQTKQRPLYFIEQEVNL